MGAMSEKVVFVTSSADCCKGENGSKQTTLTNNCCSLQTDELSTRLRSTKSARYRNVKLKLRWREVTCAYIIINIRKLIVAG